MRVFKTRLLDFLPGLICMICASMVLAGCAYFDAPEGSGETVDLMAGEDAGQAQGLPAEPLDLMSVAGHAAGRNVEVYSLDKPVDSRDALAPLFKAGQTRARLSNSSVEVFPLEGGVTPQPLQRMDAAPAVPAAPVEPVEVEQEGEASEGFAPFKEGNAGAVRLYFDHDSVTLDSENARVVASTAQKVKGGPVKVSGHASKESSITDPVKRKMVNLKISMDRALAVARGLIMGGVPAEQIETAAYGEVRPSPPVDGKDAESASRRVEILSQSLQ